MARRRYGEVTSGSGKSHQGRRITMAQPVSSILGDVVKSGRSIAHSDDFEGHKLIQTDSRQLILLDLSILYWCPASRDQTKPLLVQPQISCNARCASMSWTALKKFLLSYPPRNCELEKKPSFHCGRKAWQVLSVLRLRRLLCLFRLAPSCRLLRRLARWCEMAQMVSTATQPRYATAMFHSNQPEHSLSLLVSPARTSRQRQTRRPRLLFSVSAKCLHERQQQEEATAAGGSSSRSSSSRKQQQQEEEAAAAAGGSSSSRKR